MVITKEKIKLGINCAIFGLSFVIGSTWIKNIELFFEFGKQNYDYILCGLGEAIIIPVIFGGLGIILYYYHKEGILSLILSIVQSLVYYKKHTSNLLTLKSESGILWSS